VICAISRSPARVPAGRPTVSDDAFESVADAAVDRFVIGLAGVVADVGSVSDAAAYVEESQESIAFAEEADGPIVPIRAKTASEANIVRGRLPNTCSLSADGRQPLGAIPRSEPARSPMGSPPRRRVASRPVTSTGRSASYPRHNWLPAVIPADARRFRVVDQKLASTLTDAGGEVVQDDADVEITPAESLTGEAPYSVAQFELVPPEGGPRLARALRRLRGSLRVRRAARNYRPKVRRLGYPTTAVVLWEWEQHLRLPGAETELRWLDVAERLPLSALVIGSRRGHPPTVLDSARDAAKAATGRPLEARSPLVRQGGLVSIADAGVLRVALGPATQELSHLRAAIESLERTSPPEIVANRVPWIIATGDAGLAGWLLELRLAGSVPSPKLTDELVADCIEFLVALHRLKGDDAAPVSLIERSEIIAQAANTNSRDAVRALGAQLEADLADVQRGFAHGDFWIENLLTERGRLVGVVDWHGAGGGRLPLLDLLHLRLSSVFAQRRQYLGTALVEYLIPWARSGGDGAARAYCEQVGVDSTSERLEKLVLAYWITRTARELEMYADRVERPLWMKHNVDFVIEKLAAPGR
jgi:aminoglycoside phosphotransferase (APT) family kinase protein